jgi:hypothetical protein
MFCNRIKEATAAGSCLCVLSIAMLAALAGCGGNNNLTLQNPPALATTPVSIAFNPKPTGSISLVGSAPITAVVSNDPTDAGVDWALLCKNAGNCGTLTPLHTASVKPTLYAPPASISGNSQSVTIEAFATANHNSNATTSLTVTGFAANLKGKYVFTAHGQDAGPYVTFDLAGVIVLDGNGNVTSGEETYCTTVSPASGPTALVSASDKITGGSYYIGPDGRGTLTVVTSDPNVGQSGQENFALQFISSSEALLQTSDNETNVNLPPSDEVTIGTLELQTSTAAPSGGYAFVADGVDVNDAAIGLGGVVNIDSPGSISGNGSVADVDEADDLVINSPLTGTVTNPDSFGAVTFNLATTNTTADFNTTLQFTGYIVDASHIKLSAFDITQTNNQGSTIDSAMAYGVAIGQGTATGTFLNDSAFAGNYVFDISGQDPSSVPFTLGSFGQFSADSSGNLNSGYADEVLSFSGTVISDSFTGTYSFLPAGTGRVDTNSSINFSVSGPGPELIFYLTGNGNPPLVLDADLNTGSVGFGLAHPQAAAPYSFNGQFGGEFVQSSVNIPASTYTGQVTATETSGSYAGAIDQNANFSPTPDTSVAGTFGTIPPTGRFTGTLNDTNFQAAPVIAVAFYPIDPEHILFIETDYVSSGLSTFGRYVTRTPVCSGCP